MDSPRSGPSSPRTTPSRAKAPTAEKQPAPLGPADSDDDDDDDEGPSLETMRAFGRQVQRAPTTAAPQRIVIPKRGEKDFEPLNETVTIQEKMLRESRQALFDGLSGVRGTSSKNISHATLSTKSPFPQVEIIHGNLFLTLGHTIRPPFDPAQPKTTTPASSSMELLPEEALYLLERGSLQIWVHPSAYDPQLTVQEQEMVWNDAQAGFEGCVEMSAMEAFSRFIGRDGLTLERYQVYAGLKRLGYTVQRTERFLPPRFRKPASRASQSACPQRTRTTVASVIRAALRRLIAPFLSVRDAIRRMVAPLVGRRRGEGAGLLGRVTASGYGALYSKLRIIPSGHAHPSTKTPRTPPTPSADPFACLDVNPYLPFFHVWKPVTHWTRAKWDRGSVEGLESLPPDFWIAVVDARSVPFPTLPQMEEIFPSLPAIPTPIIRPRPAAPPRGGKPADAHPAPSTAPQGLLTRLRALISSTSPPARPPQPPQVNTFQALKQGDRSLIVAVVDGGNVGWTRLGRGGFQEHVMVPNEMM